jgi:glutathione S-transferase
MYSLYHYPLCPLSRQIRLILQEKSLPFESIIEDYWHKSNAFPEISPSAGIPILNNNHQIISDASAIYEYLEEQHPERNLLGDNPLTRAQSRRIANCFNSSFFHLISKTVLMQRIIGFNNNPSNASVIHQIRDDVRYFIDYIAYLLKKNKWLSGNEISIADFVAASHFSVLDYFGDIPWEHNEYTKQWYAVIKSRPSFKPILQDRIAGFSPNKYYTLLDF